MTKITFQAKVFQEGEVFVAVCPELNVSSFGEDIQDAKRSLQEAVEAFIEACEEMGTLEEVLEEAGYRHEGDTWTLRKPVAEEILALSR